MSTRKHAKPVEQQPKVVRCAVYTRKSTEEGLEQAFNSLDAQRESAEAFVAAQRHEGWCCLPDRYDDGGFSGGTIDRPALRRLLADIEAGKVDCVVVYKVDRLSRSLLDFSRVMQTFENHRVSFVSVTQQFNTTHSMGRLTLNILLSFAQFEREIISERTRDKIAAARRKGKFAGGKPLLGYDILSSPQGPKLIVNEDEAHVVRRIYEAYLRHQALIPTVRDLQTQGWANKRWTTKKGQDKGGRPFDKTTLYKLLTNRTYTGVVCHQGQSYPGEHPAIVEQATFDKVQAVLGRNGRTAGAAVRNRYGALLKGLLHCACCDCSMGHTYSVKAGAQAKRYRYYVCLSAQKKGWDSCPSKSVPAGEVERFVVDQIRSIGRDPALVAGTLRQVHAQQAKQLADLRGEAKAAERELVRNQASLRKATDEAQRADAAERVLASEQRLTRLRQRAQDVANERVEPGEVQAALSAFTPVWEQLTPKEQARVINLLVERVGYDGSKGEMTITFRPGGLKGLAREQGYDQHSEAA